MIIPVRLRLSRARGFDLQVHSMQTNGLPAISCARPGPLGNPFVVGRDGDRRQCVYLCRRLLSGQICITPPVPRGVIARQHVAEHVEAQRATLRYVTDHLGELPGHNLACWCDLPRQGEPDVCHAAVLLEMAAAYASGHLRSAARRGRT